MTSSILQLRSLTISLDSKIIVKDITLNANLGDIIIIKGPNGAGKTSLFRAIAGDNKFDIKGNIILKGRNITQLGAYKRAKAGIFLVFQEPPSLPGISFNTLFRETLSVVGNDRSTKKEEKIIFKILEINQDKMNRNLNDGFSGGEKKKMELLQLLLAKPKVALIDEIDSGMDAEGIKLIVEAINYLRSKGTAILIITHQQHWTSLLSKTKTINLKQQTKI